MKYLRKGYYAYLTFALFSLPFFLSLGILNAADAEAKLVTTKISVVTFVSLGKDYHANSKF
jgi:hypothetical protein